MNAYAVTIQYLAWPKRTVIVTTDGAMGKVEALARIRFQEMVDEFWAAKSDPRRRERTADHLAPDRGNPLQNRDFHVTNVRRLGDAAIVDAAVLA